MLENKILNAYKSSHNIYDDVLTQTNWLARLYIKLFWKVDDYQIAEIVLSSIPDNFSGKLLDIPVGTAVFTYKKYINLEKAEITCIDYSNEMLNQAKQRLESLSPDKITCLQGDAANLLFNDNYFDIVLSMNGFHAFQEKEKAFAETARVLKKGGLFIGCFYIKNENLLTDFIVNSILSKKGWFTPPFYTKVELTGILKTMYSKVEVSSEQAIVWFKCIK